MVENHYPVEETCYPMVETHHPVEESVYPVEETSYPEEETSYPMVETGYPVEETRYPVASMVVLCLRIERIWTLILASFWSNKNIIHILKKTKLWLRKST